MAEILRVTDKFNPRKLFGVTTLDMIRAATFGAQFTRTSPEELRVPVVGGHSRHTIVPLFTQSIPPMNLSKNELRHLIESVQCGGDEVQQAKAGAGTATLCMGHAAFMYTPRSLF
jgi:malate dehydrogenase